MHKIFSVSFQSVSVSLDRIIIVWYVVWWSWVLFKEQKLHNQLTCWLKSNRLPWKQGQKNIKLEEKMRIFKIFSTVVDKNCTVITLWDPTRPWQRNIKQGGVIMTQNRDELWSKYCFCSSLFNYAFLSKQR